MMANFAELGWSVYSMPSSLVNYFYNANVAGLSDSTDQVSCPLGRDAMFTVGVGFLGVASQRSYGFVRRHRAGDRATERALKRL